jgi:glutathione S-transferase
VKLGHAARENGDETPRRGQSRVPEENSMLVLYDNPFSPFTRKVRMVLQHKGLAFRSVDGLALDELRTLRTLSCRAEVPVLVDGDVVVVDSADIVAYLDDLHPLPPILPNSAVLRAKARRWHRLADRSLDAILHDISLWVWPTHQRSDEPPPGLIEAGQRDLWILLDELDCDLESGAYIAGAEPSIADFAVFPHVSSLRFVGISLTEKRLPRVFAWQRRMRDLPAVQQDLETVRRGMAEKFPDGRSPYEAEKVIWRGDRIEWLLCNGFDAWWASERAAGRAVVPTSVGRGDA